MARNWSGKRCPECGEGVLHENTRRFSADYRGETFAAMQTGAYCNKCSDGIVYDDPEFDQKWDAFRKRVDSEQAAELKAIRKRLGLTQEQASKLTGGGHNAISRYECEATQPMMAVINIFRLFDKYPILVSELLPEYVPPVQPSRGQLTATTGYIDLALLYTGAAYAVGDEPSVGIIGGPIILNDPGQMTIHEVVFGSVPKAARQRVEKPKEIKFEKILKLAEG